MQRKAHLRKIAVRMSESIDNSCKKLSLPATEVHLSTISSASLKSIWEKAERLLNTPDAVVPAPGSKSGFMVVSDSSSRPHFVEQKKGGRVLCDDNCPMWRGRRICSHTIVVAERLNCLQGFLQALQKSKPECNLTSLVTTITDRRNAGTKSGAPMKQRKVCSKTPITTCRSRLDDASHDPVSINNDFSETAVQANCSKDVSVGCYNFLHLHRARAMEIALLRTMEMSPIRTMEIHPLLILEIFLLYLEVHGMISMISLDITCMVNSLHGYTHVHHPVLFHLLNPALFLLNFSTIVLRNVKVATGIFLAKSTVLPQILL